MASACTVKGTIVVLIGLPASGKSTLSNELRRRFHSIPGWNSVLVSYDNILNDRAHWGDPDYNWKSDRALLVDCVRHFLHNPQGVEIPPKTSEAVKVWDKFLQSSLGYAAANNSSVIGWRAGACEKKSKIRTRFKFDHEAKSESYISGTGTGTEFSDVINLDQKSGFNPKTLLLIDDNFYYKSMRYPYFQLARDFGYGFLQIYLPCSKELARERNQNRTVSEKVQEEVIVRMAERLEIPNSTTEPWEHNSCVACCDPELGVQPLKIATQIDQTSLNETDTSSDDSVMVESKCDDGELPSLNLNQLVEMIAESSNNPPEPLEDCVEKELEQQLSRQITKANRIHTVDLILREGVRQILSEKADSANEKRVLGKMLAESKKHILEKFKSGKLECLDPAKDTDKLVALLSRH